MKYGIGKIIKFTIELAIDVILEFVTKRCSAPKSRTPEPKVGGKLVTDTTEKRLRQKALRDKLMADFYKHGGGTEAECVDSELLKERLQKSFDDKWGDKV
jgi:hypothetical protein